MRRAILFKVPRTRHNLAKGRIKHGSSCHSIESWRCHKKTNSTEMVVSLGIEGSIQNTVLFFYFTFLFNIACFKSKSITLNFDSNNLVS